MRIPTWLVERNAPACTGSPSLPEGSVPVRISYADYCFPRDNLQIQAKTPVPDVVKIVLQPVGNRCIATKAVDLGPPCHSDFAAVPHVVFIEVFLELRDKI